MNGRPLVAVACCWIAGTSLLSLVQGTGSIIALLALLLLLACLAVRGYASPRLAVLCAVAIVLAAGERSWAEHRLASRADTGIALSDGEKSTINVTGKIGSVVEVDGDLVMFKLKVRDLPLSDVSVSADDSAETILVRVKLAKQEDQAVASSWQRGDDLRVSGTLGIPGEAGNFGDFDYRLYLSKMGIRWQLSAAGLSSVSLMESSVSLYDWPLRILDRWREGIGAVMDKLYPRGDAGYMKGLVVGLRSDLDPHQYDGFARLGLTHVLAISGLHVGVVVYILLQLGSLLRLTRENTLAIAISAMPLYMLITGASPSAVRACLMAMIALWLARRNELKDGLHLLLAAAMGMLIWNPRLIEDVSFQLSFLVTAGLILFVPTVNKTLPIPWPWLRGPVAVALTAQFISFPVTIYYFHAVHLLSLPANFFLVPFISFFVMPLGMASVVLGGIWLPLGSFPATLASLGNRLTFAIVDWLDGFTNLRTIWPQPSLLWVFAAYVLMGVGLYGLRRRLDFADGIKWWEKQAADAVNRDEEMTLPLNVGDMTEERTASQRRSSALRRSAFVCATLLWIVWGIQPAGLDRSAAISFLNVGQGDSILIRTGQGKHILVDAGGTVSFRKSGEEWRERRDPYEVGRKLIVPLLLKRGVGQLDALVLTHLDADHIGGAAAIIRNIPVGALFFNGTIKDSPVAISLLRLAEDMRIPCYSLHAPMEWTIDHSAKIRVLYPTEGQADYAKPELMDEQNERSVTLLLTMYGRTFLLQGDLESTGEREIVESESRTIAGHTEERYPIDVLKAGHHGSKTSTTQIWMDYWNPRETVISVGERNTYGHPNGDVLQRLAAAGIDIWRTDLNGEVQYRISPNGKMSRRMLNDSSLLNKESTR